METRQYTTVDRSGWPHGLWDDEPDKIQWQDEVTKLPCLAVRNPHMGNWCGYVGVPPGHKFHGEHYNEINADVHGGLTFSDSCQPHEDESKGICHVPGPGEPHDIWWLGFDCGHSGDLIPLMFKLHYSHDGNIYRTLAYVQAECAQLAQQLV